MSDKREETKARNRLALIEATIASIADLGFVDTSVTRIIERANLSRGMIHLHFGSKDNLMLAAVKHASEQYYRELERRLPANNASPQQRLEAIISADLSDGLLNETSANVWYAFRGEAREQAAFAKYSSTRDKRLKELVLEAFTMIASETDEPDPRMLARDATHGVLALLEGMWMDYLLHTNSFNRGTAKRIVLRFLSAMFPNHFDLRGHI
ncbi:MAG: TetR family transcriptional regulator C-terminal domain-containing protein [Geminicoccaceae bacterium]